MFFKFFESKLTFLRGSHVFGFIQDSAVGIATSYGLDDQGIEFESQWGQEFSLLHVVQTDPGAHHTSYPMGTGGPFPGGKAAGA
jgi:hypothetical protein